METVVITGIKGQTGSYAADLYLAEGHKVIGVHRRCSLPDFVNIQHNFDNPNFILEEADICDTTSITEVIKKYSPSMWLNFAAQSHVGSSYFQPISTSEVNYMGVLKVLECIRLNKPDIKFWNAASSERYGNATTQQSLDTPPNPISPYAVAKVASEYLVESYKQTYGMYTCYSIMFNNESPRRSKAFVTRKISDFIGRSFNKIDSNIDKLSTSGFISTQDAFSKAIKDGLIDHLHLGNLNAKRSWTHSKDVVYGIFLQMQLNKPENFIFGLEETHSITDFLDEAFGVIGVSNWSEIVKIDPKFFRPSDVGSLKPYSLDARERLGWCPIYRFKDIVKEMVEHDIKINSK